MPALPLADFQTATILNPYTHFCFYGGVATGKTFTGSQFAITMVRRYPKLTGFIGANSYDQLSQATLREFIMWLDAYKMEYVIDCQPPPEWQQAKKFKSYKNIISIYHRKLGFVTHIFTRVLSKGDPLRGVQFAWYWIDETRDTPQNTHDILLSRMRESKTVMKGLVTTTTFGEDWSYKRFVKSNDGSMLFGSMHVPSYESVKAGIITEEFYKMLLSSYSELMAQQELHAMHVNVGGGRAYYAWGDWNRRIIAPWGDANPNAQYPLIVMCDFNYSPAPLVWEVGQMAPSVYPHAPHLHVFNELSEIECSTEDMTLKLINNFPGFHYMIFGDASGTRGTTSNAGVDDYNQIANILNDHGCTYTIDYFQPDTSKANPKVKRRVENMNAKLKNALGETKITYNPYACPLLDGDFKMVGWKKTMLSGNAALSDGGDSQRTHASDGVGYGVWKLMPPGIQATMIESNQSILRVGLDGVLGQSLLG